MTFFFFNIINYVKTWKVAGIIGSNIRSFNTGLVFCFLDRAFS